MGLLGVIGVIRDCSGYRGHMGLFGVIGVIWSCSGYRGDMD